jgi:hypothetical protein
VLEGCEVGGRVIGSDAAFVVAEDHIHHPVQAVLSGKELARCRTLRLGPFPAPPHQNCS